MAEINITGQKLLQTIVKEFQEQYPNLSLAFFNKEEWDKAQQGASSVSPLPTNKRLSEVRTKSAPAQGEHSMSLHGRTLIGNFEDTFAKEFGIYVQVIYKIDKNWYYTSGDQDKKSLTAFNREVAERNQDK